LTNQTTSFKPEEEQKDVDDDVIDENDKGFSENEMIGGEIQDAS
jgi:hypothetical protein